MFKIFAKSEQRYFLIYLVVLGASLCQAGEHLDKSRYIGIDEVRPGMKAYCLTAYEGEKIEKFALVVLDVVRNVSPGRDAILVQGTDERFIHTGPVAGCSGSPVYINGRLAGALAFGWSFSKDPLYGVTPIEEMLKVGQPDGRTAAQPASGNVGFVFDFTVPIDFGRIDRQMSAAQVKRQSISGGATVLPCPLITSGLPDEVCERLNSFVEPFGFMAVGGIGGGGEKLSAERAKLEAAKLVPGACLTVPLVTGDITMDVIGTVTEVVDDKVYGFGHSLLGYGAIDLPMATGKVHTVVSSVIRSFKFASAVEIVGALTMDESAAILGRIGAKAQMFPLTIKVDRYNDTQQRVYHCEVANNRLLTPQLLRSAVAGAALRLGELPPDNMIDYKVAIDIDGAEAIAFKNVSTATGLNEMLTEIAGSVALLMNNPYKKVGIKSVDVAVRETAKNIASHIWSVNLSDSKVKAGEIILVSVVAESFLAGKKKYQFSMKIPEELAPGKYDLIISGGDGYLQFLRKAVPYRFVPQNLASLVESMNNILEIERDRLYCLLVLPAEGIAVEKAELPDLPATKAMVMQDAKRALKIQAYPHWVENSLKTKTIVIDRKVMHIMVEK